MDQKSFRAIILCLLLVLSPACFAGGKQAMPEWRQLTPTQQQVLAPLVLQWAKMSSHQRSRLIAVAEQYPKMTPQARARFQKRIKIWASLSREQRKQARANYRQFHRLPKRSACLNLRRVSGPRNFLSSSGSIFPTRSIRIRAAPSRLPRWSCSMS